MDAEEAFRRLNDSCARLDPTLMNPHPADSHLGWLASSSTTLASTPYHSSGNGHLTRPSLADRLTAVRTRLEELQTLAQRLARTLTDLGCDANPHHVLWCHALTRLTHSHGDLQGRLNAFERVRALEDWPPDEAHACVDRFEVDLDELEHQFAALEIQIARAAACEGADLASRGGTVVPSTREPLTIRPSEVNPGARLYAFILYDALRTASEWVEVAPAHEDWPPPPIAASSPVGHFFDQPDLLAEITQATRRCRSDDVLSLGPTPIPAGPVVSVSVVQACAGTPATVLMDDRRINLRNRDCPPVKIDLSVKKRESSGKRRNFHPIHFVEEFLEDMEKMDETETHPRL